MLQNLKRRVNYIIQQVRVSLDAMIGVNLVMMGITSNHVQTKKEAQK